LIKGTKKYYTGKYSGFNFFEIILQFSSKLYRLYTVNVAVYKLA